MRIHVYSIDNPFFVFQGNFPEAQRLLEDALFMCEELLGPLHPATAISLNNLAGLLHSCGNYEAALPIYNRSLTIKEKAFGADHPDVASTLNNIGTISLDLFISSDCVVIINILIIVNSITSISRIAL